MRYKWEALPLRYAFCDPAGSRARKEVVKKARARSAIVAVAPDAVGRLFVVVAKAGRWTTSEMIDRIIETCQEIRPQIFGIEANAMQALFADSVELVARMRNLKLPLSSVRQPTNVDKLWRIRTTIQPVLAEGRLFIREDQTELRTELEAFPSGRTVDLVDALASAIELVPPPAIPQEAQDDADQLAAYLRASGAPPDYILERLSELSGSHV